MHEEKVSAVNAHRVAVFSEVKTRRSPLLSTGMVSVHGHGLLGRAFAQCQYSRWRTDCSVCARRLRPRQYLITASKSGSDCCRLGEKVGTRRKGDHA